MESKIMAWQLRLGFMDGFHEAWRNLTYQDADLYKQTRGGQIGSWVQNLRNFEDL